MSLVIILFVYILLSWITAWSGRNRVFGFWGYFFASLLLTPLLGVLFVVASAPREPSVIYITGEELKAIEARRTARAGLRNG